MSGDTQEDNILMNPGDVCTLLNLKQSTLRKYALLLHKAGYKFHVNENGQRGYFNKDVIVLKRFMEVKESRDMTLEQAANSVMAWVEQSDVSVRDTENEDENNRYGGDIKELKETVQKQNELLLQLMGKLDDQQAFFEKRLKEQEESFNKALEEKTPPQQQEYLEQPKEEQDRDPSDLVRNRLRIRRGQEAEKEDGESTKKPWVSDYEEVENEEESIKKEADPEEPEKKGFWARLFGK